MRSRVTEIFPQIIWQVWLRWCTVETLEPRKYIDHPPADGGGGYAKHVTTFGNALIVIDKVKPSGRQVNLGNQDEDEPAFSRQASERQALPLPRDAIARVIDRVAVQWKGNSEASIVARRFANLSAEVVAAAEAQGYSNNDPKDRINGVAYQGRIYVVQKNGCLYL